MISRSRHVSGLAQTRIGIRQNQWALDFRRLASIAVSGRISRCRPHTWRRQLAALNYLLKPFTVQSHDKGALRNVVCEALQPSKIQDQGRLSMSTRSLRKYRNFYRALPKKRMLALWRPKGANEDAPLAQRVDDVMATTGAGRIAGPAAATQTGSGDWSNLDNARPTIVQHLKRKRGDGRR